MELDVQHIQFYQLSAMEKVHYCLGLGYYTLKLTSIFFMRSAYFILANSAMLIRWTLGGVYSMFSSFIQRLFNNEQLNFSNNDDSSEENLTELFERQF